MATVFDFGPIVNNPAILQDWLVEQGLLPEDVDCPVCSSRMKVVAGRKTLCCSKRSLHPDSKAVKVSLLKNTFFEGSRGSQQTIMKLVNCFSLRMTYDTTMQQSGCGRPMVAKWFAYCREVCLNALELEFTRSKQ